jgi:hypothetical protein
VLATVTAQGNGSSTIRAQYLADAISHGDQPEMLDLYEQACRPLAEKLLEPDLAPAL